MSKPTVVDGVPVFRINCIEDNTYVDIVDGVPSEPKMVGITDAQVNEDEFVHVDQLNDSLFFVSATQYDMICAFLEYCKEYNLDNVDDWKEWIEFLRLQYQMRSEERRTEEPQI